MIKNAELLEFDETTGESNLCTDNGLSGFILPDKVKGNIRLYKYALEEIEKLKRKLDKLRIEISDKERKINFSTQKKR